MKGMIEMNAPLLPTPVVPATEAVTCAYQGVPGAWSEQAARCLYPDATHTALQNFEDVFVAVKEGKADYGVVPIENSKSGAIGENYDLLRKYGCYIVGRTTVSIKQNLVGLPAAEISDVREVLSHPEALKQCSRYLRDRPWEQMSCRNTAVAARQVLDSNDLGKTAISSKYAAELYGLKVLAPDIMDADDNQTSFVVIADHPEYDLTSNLISVTFSTKHQSGALCKVLMALVVGDLNLLRIESRPAPGGNYRFFADIEGNIENAQVISTLRQASFASESFEVLGCYKPQVCR